MNPRPLFRFSALAVLAVALMGAGPHADEAQNLFISPAGEPFLAPASQPFPIVDWFEEADTNHDGKLDADEFRADALRFFNVLDRNHDGVLTSDEIYIYEHQMVPEILNVGISAIPSGLILADYQFDGLDPDVSVNYDHEGSKIEADKAQAEADGTAPRPANPEGATFFSLFDEPEPVMAADRNFDFKVTQKEFLDLSDRHFATLDAKQQGYLTLAGLPQSQAEQYVHGHRTVVASRKP